MSIEQSNDLIGHRTRDLPAYSIVLQPTTLSRALIVVLDVQLFFFFLLLDYSVVLN
jgi:hypothetical protein